MPDKHFPYKSALSTIRIGHCLDIYKQCYCTGNRSVFSLSYPFEFSAKLPLFTNPLGLKILYTLLLTVDDLLPLYNLLYTYILMIYTRNHKFFVWLTETKLIHK